MQSITMDDENQLNSSSLIVNVTFFETQRIKRICQNLSDATSNQ